MQENIWIHASKYKQQVRLDHEWDKLQTVTATYMALQSGWHYESSFWEITIVFLELEAKLDWMKSQWVTTPASVLDLSSFLYRTFTTSHHKGTTHKFIPEVL